MSKFVYLYIPETIRRYRDDDGQLLFRAGHVIEAARVPPSPHYLDEDGEPTSPGWCSRYNCHLIRQGEAYEPDPTQQGYKAVEAYIEREYDTNVDLDPFISAMG